MNTRIATAALLAVIAGVFIYTTRTPNNIPSSDFRDAPGDELSATQLKQMTNTKSVELGKGQENKEDIAAPKELTPVPVSQDEAVLQDLQEEMYFRRVKRTLTSLSTELQMRVNALEADGWKLSGHYGDRLDVRKTSDRLKHFSREWGVVADNLQLAWTAMQEKKIKKDTHGWIHRDGPMQDYLKARLGYMDRLAAAEDALFSAPELMATILGEADVANNIIKKVVAEDDERRDAAVKKIIESGKLDAFRRVAGAAIKAEQAAKTQEYARWANQNHGSSGGDWGAHWRTYQKTHGMR